MSSVAGAGGKKRVSRQTSSPGDTPCGTCQRVDSKPFVQCDECDVWYHYECVKVDDGIQNKDWSCNGCVRNSLEKEISRVKQQQKIFEEQQKQWEKEQQARRQQDEERQSTLEQRQTLQQLQQQGGEQFEQMQMAMLQFLRQNMQAQDATGVLCGSTRLPATRLDANPKRQDDGRVFTFPEQHEDDNQRNTGGEPSSTAGKVAAGKPDNASSKGSRRSAKVREQQLKALEARQALEKKQLEERLAFEEQMLDDSSVSSESILDANKIEDWLDKTNKLGLEESPLPVYNQFAKVPGLTSKQQCFSNDMVSMVHANQHQRFREMNHADLTVSNFQAPGSSSQPAPLYTTASQPISTALAYPGLNPRLFPFASNSSGLLPSSVPHTSDPLQPLHSSYIPLNSGRPISTAPAYPGLDQRLYPLASHSYDPLATSVPHTSAPLQLLDSSCIPLNSGHLAARQTVKDLPKFGGDPEDWPRFIAAYDRTSRMCAFRHDELLDSLERSLHDKALNAVKSLLLHPNNVPVIMNRLKTLFGNPESIIETMVRRVKMMPPMRAEKLESIVDFGVAVQNLCATIQVCQMDERLYNVTLLQELVDSLPSTLKMQWAFYRKETKTATLLDFNEWLGKLVEAISQVSRPQVWAKPLNTEKKGRKEEAYLHVHSTQVSREGAGSRS